MTDASTQFSKDVLFVIEISTRRWRYWDSLWDEAEKLPVKEVKQILGWDKKKIEDEWCLALSDLLLGD